MAEEAASRKLERNSQEAKVGWQFTSDDTRINLEGLYPTIDLTLPTATRQPNPFLPVWHNFHNFRQASCQSNIFCGLHTYSLILSLC